MPYVNVKITEEGDVSPQQKADLIRGITECLSSVLGKDPATTFVVIEQVPLDAWGIGGLPVAEYRARKAAGAS